MRELHVIMPMAGEGSRFLKEGWTTPKPLIEINGMPLFMRAINSINNEGICMRYSFIVRQEHIDKYQIDQKIKEILPQANIFIVQKTTRGAVETCLKAEKEIMPNEAVLIMDCDLEFSSQSLMNKIRDILSKPSNEVEGGLLVSFESNNPRYSYAEVNDDNIVLRTAEKEVISNHALCGAYFFSTGAIFLDAAHKLMKDENFNKPEFYLSLLYNYLLQKGEKVKLCPMEKYYSYGTPEELKQYL